MSASNRNDRAILLTLPGSHLALLLAKKAQFSLAYSHSPKLLSQMYR